MTPFAQPDATAREEDFSGVVRIERAGEVAFSQAYGLANRALAVPNSDDTVFALASGTKAFTALAVLCLVHDGVLSLQIRARELLGSDLPVINDAVTVEMLLAHRSGFGDYLDEAADWDVNDHVLSVPVHTLADTQSFLAIVGGYPQVFCARGAPRLLQRRVHRVGAAGRAGRGHPIPRHRGTPGVPPRPLD